MFYQELRETGSRAESLLYDFVLACPDTEESSSSIFLRDRRGVDIRLSPTADDRPARRCERPTPQFPIDADATAETNWSFLKVAMLLHLVKHRHPKAPNLLELPLEVLDELKNRESPAFSIASISSSNAPHPHLEDEKSVWRKISR